MLGGGGGGILHTYTCKLFRIWYKKKLFRLNWIILTFAQNGLSYKRRNNVSFSDFAQKSLFFYLHESKLWQNIDNKITNEAPA